MEKMEMTDQDAPLPCPFCGERPESHSAFYPPIGRLYGLSCSCSCFFDCRKKSEKDAAKDWNLRVSNWKAARFDEICRAVEAGEMHTLNDDVFSGIYSALKLAKSNALSMAETQVYNELLRKLNNANPSPLLDRPAENGGGEKAI
jgi:Restriction alleviation protein Lar